MCVQKKLYIIYSYNKKIEIYENNKNKLMS